jgi:hypothetical protein
MTPTSRVVLLGPQRDDPDVGRAVADLNVSGPVAAITAGWQEWEDDDALLRRALGRPVVNLRLYARAEEIWREDPDLARGHRRLQRRAILLRRAYNIRLAAAMEAWATLVEMREDEDVLAGERQAALDAVRALDDQHAARLTAFREAFHREYAPLERAAVASRREAIAAELESAGAVVIPGGHLPALLNRLRLFGLDSLLARRPVVAWSAGAMAMARRVVLFHDSPPWGPGHAEVGEVGLGLIPGVVLLPDASRRLRLGDPVRGARLSRRFAPDTCLLLDPGDRVEWAGEWRSLRARHLTVEGQPHRWSPAA